MTGTLLWFNEQHSFFIMGHTTIVICLPNSQLCLWQQVPFHCAALCCIIWYTICLVVVLQVLAWTTQVLTCRQISENVCRLYLQQNHICTFYPLLFYNQKTGNVYSGRQDILLKKEAKTWAMKTHRTDFANIFLAKFLFQNTNFKRRSL